MISILITLIVRYAGSRPDLIEEEGREEVVALAAQSSPNLGFYVVVLALAFLAPKVAAFGFLAIAVFAIMRVRGEPHGGTLVRVVPRIGSPATAGGCLERCHRSPPLRRSERSSSRRSTRGADRSRGLDGRELAGVDPGADLFARSLRTPQRPREPSGSRMQIFAMPP